MPASDSYPGSLNQNQSGNVPAVDAVAVTPNDGADLTLVSRALYIGVSGDVRVTMRGAAGTAPVSATVVFKAVPVGILPVRVTRVWATNTTATNIVALQ